MTGNSVVPKIEPLGEDEFHDSFNMALTRLIKRHGKRAVAKHLDVSERHLGNLSNGSLPAPFRLWNLLALDRSAHQELDEEYGLRKVPKDALCSTDPIAAKKAALLSKIIEAEQPDSPGGVSVVLQEICGFDENDLRDVHERLGQYLNALTEARKPTRLRVAK